VLAEVQAEVAHSMAELRDALDGQVGAIGNVTGYLSGGTDRLVAAGQSLLAYLGERDRMLERERDRMLHEVLEEFAEGLSPRERRAVASRVTEAVDRRRDARDAARFRKDAAPEPEIPSVPSLVARLDEPLPEPGPLRTSGAAARRTSSLRPAAKPAAAKPAAPAKRAPATSAASKTTAKKTAPAKRAPAKSAAAKTTAKKAVSAKKAPAPVVDPQVPALPEETSPEV
jgi:hypothetical protein